MVEISVVSLTLPDGRIVFQRRTKDAQISAGLIGLFGGHVEPGESFYQAATRELAEETSLDVKNMKITHVTDYQIDVGQPENLVWFHLYKSNIDSMDFEVYEGERAEAYTIEEARKRQDLTPSSRHVITNILKDK